MFDTLGFIKADLQRFRNTGRKIIAADRHRPGELKRVSTSDFNYGVACAYPAMSMRLAAPELIGRVFLSSKTSRGGDRFDIDSHRFQSGGFHDI
jgi:hypothetical protein